MRHLTAVNLWRKIGNLWQAPVFDGPIGRMMVVAAPPGAGKSTFLDSLASSRMPTVLPGHLSYASPIAASHLHLFQLHRRRARRIDEVVVHCDILAPVLEGLEAPYRRERVLENMAAGVYETHPFLEQRLRQTEQLDIVILYVRRQKNLQRWMARESQSEKASARYGGVTWMLKESINGSELHRTMYRAWLRFCEAMNPRSITVLDANDDQAYAQMDIQDFRRQLDAGH